MIGPGAWDDAAGYEGYVGQWSRVVAPMFVNWLGVPSGLRWLDVGCGTAALTQAILDGGRPAFVTALDRSDAYLEYGRRRMQDARVEFRSGNAERLPFDPSEFDVAVSGLVLNFLDAGRVLAEQRRVVRPGGMVAAYVWDYAGGYEFIRRFWDAARRIDDQAAAYDPAVKFASSDAAGLARTFAAAGLQQIETSMIDASASFADFDAYWKALDARQGSMFEYTSRIDESTRGRIRDELSRVVPRSPGGGVTLSLRAIAVRGMSKALPGVQGD